MREAGISAIALPCRGAMRWCGHSFKPKATIVLLAFLKAGFNLGNPHCYFVKLQMEIKHCEIYGQSADTTSFLHRRTTSISLDVPQQMQE